MKSLRLRRRMVDPVVCGCGTRLEREVAHQGHDTDCVRFLDGFCSCDTYSCPACCVEPECSPLVARIRAAHVQQQEGVR